jgi:hypothetical protein
VVRWLASDAQRHAPVVFVEYTAALSLVALAAIGISVVWASFTPRQGWWWLTFGFMSLALGPFVIVAGVNTHVPTPWAVLRYLPLVSAVRTPTRFAIVTALGVAMLMAGALVAIGTKWPHRRRAIGWVTLLLLGLELLPAPRTLYDGTYSPLSDIIAADPRPVRVLNLPFGVRDGVSSAGDFSARSQFEQTRHQKALIGGYLSRVSERRLETMKDAYPVLNALLTMSERRELPDGEAEWFVAHGPAFLIDASVGYVIIDHDRVTPQFSALATEAFNLVPVASDGRVQLYRPHRRQ